MLLLVTEVSYLVTVSISTQADVVQRADLRMSGSILALSALGLATATTAVLYQRLAGTDLNVCCYQTIATTSTAPITAQQIALPRSPANQNPLAALKQRTALVHPLTNAPGLLRIFRSFIGIPKSTLIINPASSRSCW
jgi:hypothetical protein